VGGFTKPMNITHSKAKNPFINFAIKHIQCERWGWGLTSKTATKSIHNTQSQNKQIA